MNAARFSLHEVARAIGAEALGPDAGFDRVETDTRTLAPGCLFVALKGENFDGHAFVNKAIELGAAAVMVSDLPASVAGGDVAVLRVDDTRLGLGRLAAWHRARMPARLAAITGSNGKTTVKEMLAAICAAAAGESAVLATAGNFNNDIGMPLTLLNLAATHRYAVIEMGMNHAGELDYLSRLAQPDVALVNNALRAHLGFFDSVEAIARAKGEIYAGLKPGGMAIINADDPHAALWRSLNTDRAVMSFGAQAQADVRIVGTGQATDAAGLYLSTPIGRIETTLRLPGAHNRLNAAAAAAAALALGIAPEAIAAGLAACGGAKGRLQTHACLYGATLIDDTYNANPDSVLAAIAVLAARPGQRILVLGDMGELGDSAPALHREVGEQAKAAGIDRLLALGELSVETVKGFGAGGMHFERIEELLAEVENALAEGQGVSAQAHVNEVGVKDAPASGRGQQTLGDGVTVLVKGSRFMQMERVVKSFMESSVCS